MSYLTVTVTLTLTVETQLGLVQARGGAAIREDDDHDRGFKGADGDGIGESGLPVAGTDSPLKRTTCGATGPCLVQEGTGVTTGVRTDLDWVLDDEEDAEDVMGQRGSVAATEVRVELDESKATEHAAATEAAAAPAAAAASSMTPIIKVCGPAKVTEGK